MSIHSLITLGRKLGLTKQHIRRCVQVDVQLEYWRAKKMSTETRYPKCHKANRGGETYFRVVTHTKPERGRKIRSNRQRGDQREEE